MLIKPIRSPKTSTIDLQQVPGYRSTQYGSIISLFAPKQTDTPKNGNEDSPSKKSSFSMRANEVEERSRGFSMKKSIKSSIFLGTNKRGSISMSPRKPSFMSDFDDLKAKKKALDSLDVYTEEQLITIAIKILQKPRNTRSGTDVKMLVKCTEKVSFFAEMINNQDSEKHEECCRSMGYKYAAPGEIIVREGTSGQCFYIILRGIVAIYKAEKLDGSDSQIKDSGDPGSAMKKGDPLKKSTTSAFTLHHNRRLSNKGKTIDGIDTSQIHPENIYKIKILKAGEAFGELSLMDNKPRAATVICEQECHLAVLEKQYFDKLLKELERKKLFRQIDFFSSLKLFSSWSYNAVKNLYYLTSQLEFRKLMTVYKENDPAEFVYIIKVGEFKVLKTITCDLLNPSDFSLLKRGLNSPARKVELCILGPGEAFGEEEVIEQVPRRHTIVCASITATVFVIERKEFIKRVFLSQAAKKQLEGQISSRNEWREKRFSEQTVDGKKTPPNAFLRSNLDPEEFAMIKGRKPREKNVVSNIREQYFDPNGLLSQSGKAKKKGKMIPVMENIVDPAGLVSSMRDKSFLREMKVNSPKKNFFILNNMILKERKRVELGRRLSAVKVKLKSPKNEICNERKKTDWTERKEEENYGIILPVTNELVNNYLKTRTSASENEYQLAPIGKTPKVKQRLNVFLTTHQEYQNTQFDELMIEGKGSSTERITRPYVLTKRKLSSDMGRNLLPLKYSSENIRKKAHTPSHSMFAMTMKSSRNETLGDETPGSGLF